MKHVYHLELLQVARYRTYRASHYPAYKLQDPLLDGRQENPPFFKLLAGDVSAGLARSNVVLEENLGILFQ